MIERIFLVMARDFVASVGRKGFLVGVIVMPALGFLLISQLPRLMANHSPQVTGQVALIDPTGRVGPELSHALDPSVVAQRRAAAVRTAPPPGNPGAIPAPGGSIPRLSVVPRQDPGLDAGKAWLRQRSDKPQHLALIVVHPDALVRRPGQADYGSYDLYLPPRMDEDTEYVLRESLREALVAGRLAAGGIDPAAVEAMLRVASPDPIIVAAEGEHAGRRVLERLLPFICGILLFIGVIMGGTALMMSTVEEKSSRVIEVMLAAVSPLELMWGKLLAQLGVGLLTLAIYVGMGMFALLQLSMFGVVDPALVLDLLLFYLVSYLFYGALMLAVGAAVNQIAEAQSLNGPVMMLMLIPYILTPIFGRQPNAPLTVTLSFIPPFNSFAMLARLASGAPPPLWQVGLSLLAGVAAATVVVWFAAKVFRVGLLMHGKPPSFGTLLKWARMA